jgi:histidine triad (HIT) family protein
MYNHSPEKYICPLCQISRGEKTEKVGDQEGSVVFRDKFITAFISGKWWRSNPGHVIIIPNEHIENIYDLPEEIGHKIFDFSKKVARALKETYKCDGVSTRQHNEPAGDQDVWHYHLHIFPRYRGDDLYLNHRGTYWPSQEEKQPYADKLKNYFSQS